MRKLSLKIYAALIICISIFTLSSCGSLDQWAQGLQAFSDGMMGGSYTTTSYGTSSYISPSSSSSSSKEWHNCSSCSGSGRCKHCGGSGKYEYSKNGKCGVCRGTGKCAGCNGKGGWYI